tara:strand:- start:349 stop:1182 length:834 start_codon:yes stop_codon:yes gene_type:complete
MKEIRLGTITEMVELFKEYLRKIWQWAEQWLGVHYVVLMFCAGMVVGFASWNYKPPHIVYAFLFGTYITSAGHWIKTRNPRFWIDKNGEMRFTYNSIHGERSAINPYKRIKDIRANSKIPVITLIKGNKVRVEQDGQQSTRTPKKFGMAGKNGKPVHNWTLTQKFALNEGSYDFKNDVNWHLEKERVRVRQQLQGFREQLSISLGIPDFELGTDYTFQNGFFVWKTIVWRDTSIPQEEKDRVIETETYLRKKRAGAYVKASLANPDMPDYKDSDWYE